MSAITTIQTNYVDTACQTMSFDEIVEQAVKEKQRWNDRVVEELKPLCEELPPDALDPVTMEPLYQGQNFRCGHAINTTTVVTLGNLSQKALTQGLLDCPVCKTPQAISQLRVSFPFRGCIEHLIKIKKVFNQQGEIDGST